MYVVFEGIDGSGKTTQIPLVKEILVDWKINRDLYKLTVLELVESEIKEEELVSQHPNQELVLKYALQRLELQPIIQSNINNIILSDRSYISSMAYQGLSDNTQWVQEVNKHMIEPDLVILLETKPDSSYLEQVQENYKSIMEDYGFNYVSINTTHKTISETAYEIFQEISSMWEASFEEKYEEDTYGDY